MVKYYARRGDMHRARETFESMRARGIEPSSHVYSRYHIINTDIAAITG